MPSSNDRKTRRKESIDYHINETTITDTNKPADFSFHGLVDLKLLGCENARSGRLGEPPERHPVSRKFLTKGLWINNNKLISLKGLDAFAANVIDRPELITYMDFSFNRLSEIHPVVVSFANLVVLYFHGNQISSFEQLIKIHNLKKLRNVTFHGNPIARSPDYRKVIMLCMPTIVHLDHCPILKSERKHPPNPAAKEMLRKYQKTPKILMPGQPFEINDVVFDEEDVGESSSKASDVKTGDVTKSGEVKPPKSEQQQPQQMFEYAELVPADECAGTTAAPFKLVPGITKEFIRKREGSCRCGNCKR